MNTKSLPKVKLDELGMYLRTIELDYKPTTNKQRAELITEHFNVLCTEQDVDDYERLHLMEIEFIKQDYETESRKEEYFQLIGKHNLF